MQFGGFAVSPVVGCMAKDFVAQLKADGRPIVEGAFIVASYDPVRIIHRSCGKHVIHVRWATDIVVLCRPAIPPSAPPQ